MIAIIINIITIILGVVKRNPLFLKLNGKIMDFFLLHLIIYIIVIIMNIITIIITITIIIIIIYLSKVTLYNNYDRKCNYNYNYIREKVRGVFLMSSNGKNAMNFFPYLIYLYLYYNYHIYYNNYYIYCNYYYYNSYILFNSYILETKLSGIDNDAYVVHIAFSAEDILIAYIISLKLQ